ncbi:choice-of-anchor Q domain-containing protein [Dokdonella sp.]
MDRASTPQCLPTDQRRYARPGGVRCDVGAVEADADDTLFANGFES